MICDFLIFFVGVWAGVICGLFFVGALWAGGRADEGPTELDNDQPLVRVPPKAKEPPVFINTIGKE